MAIELCDDWFLTVNTDLVNAVFVAIEFQYASVALIANALDGIHDSVRGESCVRMAHWGYCEALRIKSFINQPDMATIVGLWGRSV